MPDLRVIEGGRTHKSCGPNGPLRELAADIERTEPGRLAMADAHYRESYAREPTEEERQDFALELAAIHFGPRIRALTSARPEPPEAA
jgi:hypothetical protein